MESDRILLTLWLLWDLVFLSYPDVYYENLCDELYQPQEYEVVEDNGNQHINKLYR